MADITAAPTPHRTRREPHLDNAKFWLLVLVMYGHTIGTITTRSELARTLYVFVYLFHMPAFVVVSGYFSRRAQLDGTRAGRFITSLLVPFLVFTVIYDVYGAAVWTEKIDFPFVVPQNLLWFLLSLLTWRLLTPLILRLRYPLLTSVGVSLATGLVDQIGITFSASRTLSMLPFFTLGLLLPDGFSQRLTATRVRAASAVVLLAGLGWAWWLAQHRPTSYQPWLFWTTAYDKSGLGDTRGLLWRAVVLVAATALSFAALSLVPAGRSFATPVGERSMYPYILHQLPVRLYWASPLYALTRGAVGTVAVLVLGGVIVWLLGTRPVRWLARPVVEPSLGWLVRRPDEPPAGRWTALRLPAGRRREHPVGPDEQPAGRDVQR